LYRSFWRTTLAIVGRIAQQRVGQLAELDGPLLLLACDASSYMTDTATAVDGGHLVNTLRGQTEPAAMQVVTPPALFRPRRWPAPWARRAHSIGIRCRLAPPGRTQSIG